MATKIRKPYDTSPRFQIDCSKGGKTQQHFKQECDLNFILRKYQKTGLIDHVNKHQGDYSDLTDSVTFTEAMHVIQDAAQSFETLPSSIRKQFKNNPQEFLDFVSDNSNADALVEMGLAYPKPPLSQPPNPSSSEDSQKPAAAES